MILARAQGDLRFDEVSRSMRFCFPDFVVPKKRTAAVNLVEDAELDFKPELSLSPGGDFADVGVFLSEYGLGLSENDPKESKG